MTRQAEIEARIEADYTAGLRRAGPREEAEPVLAGGVAHHSWRMSPFPVVFARGSGGEKWDVAGRRYIDLWMGHGSLMLGNAHPAVVEAVAKQMQLGQHLGGAHVMQYAWAERIRELVPSCEYIRFTASGTEATLLALRVARAWTGRPRIVRVDGHFHGWHDEALAHALPKKQSGLNPGVDEFITLVPPLDTGAVLDELAERDVAAIILEPGGGSAGSLPWSTQYLATLRRIADLHGALLIFDEVISGFRYAPGGVQALAGVRPDLTVLAKIAAGGMPGGLVGGRREVLSVVSGGLSAVNEPVHVVHAGTFNGFPLSAAAALATLDLVADGTTQATAERVTCTLVAGINAAAEAADLDVRAIHQSSIFHLLIGALDAGDPISPGTAAIRLLRERAADYATLRRALLLEGVDCHMSHGWLSIAHDGPLLDEAIGGFERAFARVRELPSFRAPAELPSTVSSERCGTTCPDPTCPSRFRLVAGCSVPVDRVEEAEKEGDAL
ncbi:aminotransferase class III-fold pyridoxal phosphate-dependent enzyme [Montanilutibacter psychrotolerans]|uniref:Aminotransferase class III-fold pyridoxal phosphate-dependent enzyme n=1 Tax=Montanilutibacter psychrotolerans TaxID=1327343 RepID=A0A3M8SPX8_9GAMM|nr:aminotransferase class III-fold pyridoxal phosphate-dependent enzyme [Lysobacter psychrotolerans]RNF83329.1 aminotransferase class III-fold pyridoxal phosphate-dependent enzyme [Lysobacter psychrotolerans]